MIKLLLSEKSANARGTLHYIISLFRFKTFNNTAKDYFLNLWDFITVRLHHILWFTDGDAALSPVYVLHTFLFPEDESR